MTGKGIWPGGGGRRDYRVISDSTRPASPKKNTIWVKYGGSHDLPDVTISRTAPSRRSGGGALTGGEVWVEPWLHSPSPFEAWPGVTVYPAAVYRYSGSSWVRMEAEFWDGSAWQVWSPHCYRNGTVYTDPGGGIALKNDTNNSSYAKATFESSYIQLWCENASHAGYAYFCTKTTVDLTNYRYIRFRGWASAAPDGANRFVHIGVMSTPAMQLHASGYTSKYVEVPSAGSFDISVDVRKFVQGLYIRGEAYGGNGSDSKHPMTAYLYEIQCVQ